MMREVPNVRQIKGDPRRRWFCDSYFELIVWYQEDRIQGFQLCYDVDRHPRAFTWTTGNTSTHHGIDDGDSTDGHHKMSPVLVHDGDFDATSVRTRFAAEAKELPIEIRRFVEGKLAANGEDIQTAGTCVHDSSKPGS